MEILNRFFKIRKSGKQIVLVSGLPRSGTSMVMRMLEAGGLPPLTDYERSADDDNPRGYYEYEAVKKLRDGEIRWLDLAVGKAVKVISALLEYLPTGYEYRVLFIERDLEEVLASQRQMLIRRGEDPNRVSDVEMGEYFRKHLDRVKNQLMDRRDISILYLNHHDLLRDPQVQAERVNDFLGGHLDVERMRDAVEPSLYRHKKSA